jgi:hypothetical protein
LGTRLYCLDSREAGKNFFLTGHASHRFLACEDPLNEQSIWYGLMGDMIRKNNDLLNEKLTYLVDHIIISVRNIRILVIFSCVCYVLWPISLEFLTKICVFTPYASLSKPLYLSLLGSLVLFSVLDEYLVVLYSVLEEKDNFKNMCKYVCKYFA